jgi:hypothetical protein
MERKAFDEIDDDALFWLDDGDAAGRPEHYHGPYKKKVYLEFHEEGPEKIFVRRETPSLAELIQTRKSHGSSADRPH